MMMITFYIFQVKTLMQRLRTTSKVTQLVGAEPGFKPTPVHTQTLTFNYMQCCVVMALAACTNEEIHSVAKFENSLGKLL